MALKKVGALWLKEKDGKRFFSGKMEFELPAGATVLIYRNDRKQQEKHPDYTIHTFEDDQPAPRNEYQQAPRDYKAEREAEAQGPPPDLDIPFSPNRY